MVLVLAGFTPTAADSQATGEYELKGAFIGNFAQFIEWPPDAFEGAASSLVVCVVGKGPLESGIETAIKGRRAGERELRTERFSESSHCHILFVSTSEQKRFGEIVRSVDNRTVTIGEDDGFLQAGGAITFLKEGNRLQFEVNLDILPQAQYRISSKLLALARKPNPGAVRR